MNVKFANGVTKKCNAPTEQKTFKTVNGETVGANWVLILRLLGEVNSEELDELITSENITTLIFTPEEAEEGEELVITGYERATSSAIRYSEDLTSTVTDIQLVKSIKTE